MIRDSLILYKDYGYVPAVCFSCEESTHLIKDCPLLSLMPDREKVLMNYTCWNSQKREPFPRRKRGYPKQNTLTMCKQVKDRAITLNFYMNKEENYQGKLDNLQISFVDSPPDSSKKSPDRMLTDKFSTPSYFLFDTSPNQMGDTLTLRTETQNQLKLTSKHLVEAKTLDNISSIKQIDHDENDFLTQQKTKLSFVSNTKTPNVNNSFSNSPSSSPVSEDAQDVWEQDIDINRIDQEIAKSQKREFSEDFSYYSESKKLSTVKTNTVKTNNTNKKTIKIEDDDNDAYLPLVHINNFDRMFLFSIYFPHNNYDQILLDMRKSENVNSESRKIYLVNKKILHKEDSKLSYKSVKSSAGNNSSNIRSLHNARSKSSKSKSNNASLIKNSQPSHSKNSKRSLVSKPSIKA